MLVFVAAPTLPVKSMKELVAHIKANPGKVSFGSSGAGAPQRMASEMLKLQQGLDTQNIPYRGSGPAVTDLIGGQVPFGFETVTVALPHIQSGKLRALGVTTAERSPFLPDAPTFKEQGFDLEGAIWRGIAVKAGTPDDALAAIQSAIDKVTASAEWKTFQQEQFQDSPDWAEAEFTERVQKDLAEQTEFLKAAGFVQ